MGDRIAIGNVEVLAVSDGVLRFDVADFFPAVPAEAWQEHDDDMAAAGRLELNIGSFLLRSDGKTLLVDTGLGNDPMPGAESGRLLAALEREGVRPDDIDMVVITHLHRDHVGWNMTPSGEGAVPTFPVARYWVPRDDWRIYSRRAGMAMFKYIKRQVVPLDELGVLDLMEGEQVLTSEVTALPTPGHTPGHTSIGIASMGERAVILGDAIHHPAQLQETDWSPRADSDTRRSTTTRAALVDRLEREGSVAMAGHFTPPGFGRVVRLEGRRYWRAL